ncbi:MAG: prepilin-type N-terminal cleavage/methylation domain-containing protein [Desulfobacterales bacterium]|nr:MAG: prepilin-type N-terminal cleavage/methylation domain-containing protein [Desulfobacterales bacterium]
MMPKRSKKTIAESTQKNGFTLVELMVTMVVAAILLAGIYAAYQAQLRTHVTQQAVVDIQQNLRGAMYFMQRSIRMAGFGDGAGFVADFATDYDDDFGETSGAITGANSIAFTIDNDDDGVIDINDSELIAYRLNNNNLEVWREDPDTAGDWNWEPIAQNIASLNFVYLDSDNSALGNPPTPADIRSVQITIEARTVDEMYTRAVAKNAQRLTVQVRCRNL